MHTASVHGVADAEARDRSSLSTEDVGYFLLAVFTAAKIFQNHLSPINSH